MRKLINMNETLSELQDIYLSTKKEEDLINLYIALKRSVLILTKDLLNQKNLFVCSDRMNEIVDTISNNIIEKYLKKETHEILYFVSYIYKSINNYIYDNYYKPTKIINESVEELKIDSKINLEEDLINKELSIEIENYINNLIDYYTLNCSDVIKEEIKYHYNIVKKRGKKINSYLYLIKKKEVRDIFVDLMTEIKIYLQTN